MENQLRKYRKIIRGLAAMWMCVAGVFSSGAQGIEFQEGTFQEILDKAKASGKSVFVDCYTTWCGPCKRMSSLVFPDTRVGDFFNPNYLSVKIDMEKGEGFEIGARYGIKAYPTLLFLDGNGEVLHKHVGMMNPEDLIEAGKKAVDPLPKILKLQKEKYDAGERSVEFLGEFADNLQKARFPFDSVFTLYLKALQEDDLQQEQHQQRIFRLTTHIQSPGIAYVVKNKEGFRKVIGVTQLTERVNEIARKGVEEAARSKNEGLYHAAGQFVKDMAMPDAKGMSLQMAMDYYRLTYQWVEFDKVATKYAATFAKGDARVLNDIAWEYYMNLTEKKYLNKALEWSTAAIAIRDIYDYNLTYALILYKLERFEESEKAADYAIIKASQEERKADSATTLKEVIQKAKARQ